MRSIRIVSLAIATIIWSANATPTFAQFKGSRAYPEYPPDCKVPEAGFLTVDADPHGFAELSLILCFDPEHESELRQKIPISLGCPPGQVRSSPFKDQGLKGLETACVIPLTRSSFQFSGELDLAPIRNLLKSVGIDELVVDLWIPRYGVVHCDPEVRGGVLYPNVQESTYALKDSPHDPTVIRYSFGFDRAFVARIVSTLGLVLLIPFAFALVFRRRGWVIGAAVTAVPVWGVAIVLLRANYFVEFLLPRPGLNATYLVGILSRLLLWIPPAIACLFYIAISSRICPSRASPATPAPEHPRSLWTDARIILGISVLAVCLIVVVAHRKRTIPASPPEAAPPASLPFRPVQIIATNGAFWIAGTDESIATSKNGGTTWELKHQKMDGEVLVDLGWVNANSGYAAGTHGLFLWTVDGGETWTPRMGTTDTTLRISCADDEHCIRKTNRAAEFTVDGGSHWSSMPEFKPDRFRQRRRSILDVLALDASHMAVLVQVGVDMNNDQDLIFTKDGGRHWRRIAMPGMRFALTARAGEYWAAGFEVTGRDESGKNIQVPILMHSPDGENWAHRPTPPHDFGPCQAQGCLLWDGTWADTISGMPPYWVFAARSTWGSVTYKWAALEGRICTLEADLVCTPSSNSTNIPLQSPEPKSGVSIHLIGSPLEAQPLGNRCLKCPEPVVLDDLTPKVWGLDVAYLEFMIRKNGSVDKVKVTKVSSPGYEPLVSHTVEKWVFQPILNSEGAAVDQEEHAMVDFVIVPPPGKVKHGRALSSRTRFFNSKVE